ncbi:cytochrome c oxidase assembly protein COX18, mitochondrial [Rhineura floridana]|uniref:cytochrome c oxidase assembly protein COX18, mitochondrial n=1 Tax=Rhineura floridana TaxID=261503 RepID=UPI002AC8773A|nr:cytochrome c oxidase assembly protein COX18, mitochondrial [Rhineura floridana]
MSNESSLLLLLTLISCLFVIHMPLSRPRPAQLQQGHATSGLTTESSWPRRMRAAMFKMVSVAVSGALAASLTARGLRAPFPLRPLFRGGARALSAQGGGGGGLGDPSGGWAWYEALSSSVPVVWMESSVAAVQAASGLPWWATVVATSALLRTGLTLPLAALQNRVIAKLENLQPEIQSLAKHLRYEVSVCAKQQGWSEKLARFHFKKNLKRIVSELYIRDNCHPFKASLLVWVQIPIWVFVSIALRNFSIGRAASEGLFIQEQLSTGGIFWFMDLTVPDSTWILPITLGILNLLIVEIFALQKKKLSRFQKYATNFFRGVSVLMIPVAATVPSCMALYWVSSSFMGLSHSLLLRSPAFRRLCHIPRTKSDSDTPYRDIVGSISAKYFLK